jgi:hypothetical protein
MKTAHCTKSAQLLRGTQSPNPDSAANYTQRQSDGTLRAAAGCMFYGPAFGAAAWAVLILAAWACL